ncbi:MAG TPA: PASTA domain-containing protein [Chitinophagaceae bacterium]|nr:PASTA domain-containing protein [Chitinophagaceae bacterium]HPN59660.1 PASTA domain-containing protein [Chitinophagaceae bacterium]
MLKAITGRPLWLNVLVGIILAIGIFALFLLSLNWITGHGKSATVPSVTGKTFEQAKTILKKAGFAVEIQDSIYVDTVPALHVIKQIPDADEVVKSNRTVFLVIRRAVPPEVEMPNLTGYSFRNAEMVLKSMDLRVGDTTFKPDFARNAVLEQIYNGVIIKPGTKIRKGSVISLVLGDGIGNQEFSVPIITGMTFCDAKAELESMGLSVGAIVLNGVTDTCNAFIFKQTPGRYDDEKRILRIRSGQTIDVWLQSDRPVTDTVQQLPE